MSLHPSLRQPTGKTGTSRNVLKRFERLQYLMGKNLWGEGRSVFGLPKIKQERAKAKKAAPKEAAPTEAAEAGSAGPSSKTPAAS